MINISGELYIGLPIQDSGMDELQDAINEYTITKQLEYSKYDHKDNKNYPKPNVLPLYKKSVTQIYNDKDGDGFAAYVNSVLDKLFPHPKLDDEVGPTKNTDCMTYLILAGVILGPTNMQVTTDHQTIGKIHYQKVTVKIHLLLMSRIMAR